MHNTQALRRAFARPTTRLGKVTAQGFLIDDEVHPELTGRIAKLRLLRKLFEDDVLLCDSQDGIQARNGTSCEGCRHPRCRPQLRLHLHQGVVIYVLDLNLTSANNLFRIEDQAEKEGIPLDHWILRLTVRNRGHWGEVRFQRVESPGPTG
jgi:hypothetical protein